MIIISRDARPRKRSRVAIVCSLVAIAAPFVLARPAAAAVTGQGGFVPITPFRLVDTRQSAGVAYGAPRFGAGEARTFQVYAANNAGVPAGAVGAVALNVTAVSPVGPGYLSVWPSDASQPKTSVLNFDAGAVVPNAVTVRVSGNGSFNVYAPTATDVLVDVMGYYTKTVNNTPEGGGFQGITPARLMDTRSGLGGARFGSGASRALQVTGTNAAPIGASAVVLNVTSVQASGPGFLTVWPDGVTRPDASNANYDGGNVIANQVTVKIGAGGYVDIFAQTGSDVLVDIMGWYAGGNVARGGFVALTPARILDTRIAFGDAYYDPTTDSVVLTIAGENGVPATSAPGGVGAFALNVTAVLADAPGYMVVWPDSRARPNASNLNFSALQTVPNAVTVGVGAQGGVDIYTPANPEVLVDLSGYFTAP
jgi:hypothetical protein